MAHVPEPDPLPDARQIGKNSAKRCVISGAFATKGSETDALWLRVVPRRLM
jgi:hypothetical protein